VWKCCLPFMREGDMSDDICDVVTQVVCFLFTKSKHVSYSKG
jgi:hypothetical protein